MGNAASSATTPPPCCPPDSLPSASAQACGATTPTRGRYYVLNDVLESSPESSPQSPAFRPASASEVDQTPSNKKAFRTYVTEPSSTETKISGVILIFHDVYGFNSARTHHMADELAEYGYVVVAPDFFDDSRYLDGWDYVWPPTNIFGGLSTITVRGTMPWKLVEARLMQHVLPFIRTLNSGPIGLLGYCWGGWAVVRAAAMDFAVCGASPHPSPHVQLLQRTGDGMDAMFHKVKVPLLLAPAFNDPPSLGDGGYYMKLLQESSEHEAARKSIGVNYPKMIHGWTNRGDLAKPAVKRDYDDFVRRAAVFYAEHLGGSAELDSRAKI